MSEFKFKSVVEAARENLRTHPDQAVASYSAASSQVEGLRSEVKARQFTITVDEPTSIGGTDEGASPVEYALAALATCQEITYRLYADSLGIPLDKVSVKVEGDIDFRGFFAVDESVRPGFKDLRIFVQLDSTASEDEIRHLHETVDAHCPVLDLLQNRTPVSVRVDHRAAVAA
ncbi:MAG: OsmC family protein [Alphaproteobacteria bacterium]